MSTLKADQGIHHHLSVMATPEAALDDVDVPMDTVRVTLLALLPKDGTPMATTHLAELANVPTWRVTESLTNDCMAGRLAFDHRADTFRVSKKADLAGAQP